MEQYSDEYSGNKVQKCLAQVEFPKTDFDEAWFGDYEVEFSARIYSDEQATDFVEIEKASYIQKFSEPVYSDSELIDEIETANDVYELHFMKQEFDFSMVTVDSACTECDGK